MALDGAIEQYSVGWHEFTLVLPKQKCWNGEADVESGVLTGKCL